MFQSFTDLFIIFVGYPLSLLILATLCHYFDNNPDRW